MKSLYKKWIFAVLFFICFGLMIFLFFHTFNSGMLLHKGLDDKAEKPVILEMKVGETLDLNEYVSGWKDNTMLYERGPYEVFRSDKIFIDGRGKLHAKEGGLYNFTVANESNLLPEVITERLRTFRVVVYDAEYDGYVRVKNYWDVINSIERGVKKLILANDFSVGGRTEDDLLSFDGVLINPNGYEISIRDNLPLFRQLGENAVVSGLRVNDDGEGFRPHISSVVYDVCGMVCIFNAGAVADCAVEADLYGGEQSGHYIRVAGIVGMNRSESTGDFRYGTILRCSFTGNAYSGDDSAKVLGGSENPIGSPGGAYGIVCMDEGGIFDCNVQGDAYAYEGLSSAFACTLYHMPLRGIHLYADEFTAIAANGNRVFDLSGRREVDFSKPVTYAVQNNFATQKRYANGYAGAIVPRDPADFSDENFYLFSVTDADGRSYSTEKPVFFGEENTTLYYEFRYRQSE